jgi:Ca-activated chloride channel family protein
MQGRSRWRATSSLAAALSVPVLLLAQPSFRSDSTELVVLPVIVTDKHGEFVSELQQDQFTVYDNGRRVAIDLFTNEDTPVSVGLVVDASSSMREKLGEVIAGALRFAQLSNPNDELFTIRFNDDVADAVADRQFLLASDFGALKTALQSLVPQGRTALYDALITALDRLDTATRTRKILVLISDGGDNSSRATLDRVLQRARASNAAIYTIGLFDREDPDRNPGVLKTIASATGGQRFLPPAPGALLQVCERIAREVRRGYTIGFVPPARDGTYHRIGVAVTHAERTLRVRTRPGYFAAAAPDQ